MKWFREMDPVNKDLLFLAVVVVVVVVCNGVLELAKVLYPNGVNG